MTHRLHPKESGELKLKLKFDFEYWMIYDDLVKSVCERERESVMERERESRIKVQEWQSERCEECTGSEREREKKKKRE
eukprot:CAMPEP_0182421534 /NCGR_PEP_ID=MMETSP1167-20130531/6956_1 /TAXON_ID=2988 /ORGANISM="Mallomonas Sp, Strain CCMP3275" /LENGTH=78 /DNA_ID=CAMNT_0024598777 /DNA_START=761 /DNA_END=995 /DNA_ORIENTATION=-